MKFVCRLVGHRRSTRYIREDYGFGWRSRCRFCGEGMIRIGSDCWLLERAARKDPKFKSKLGPTRLPFIPTGASHSSAPVHLPAERAVRPHPKG